MQLSTPARIAKLRNYVSFLESVTGFEKPANLPLHLWIEITTKCNLRCPKCSIERLTGESMPFELMAGLGPLFETTAEVQTFGFGEMFLHPDLLRFVELLKQHRCRTCGTTNGTAISERTAVRLVELGYDELTFSVDGATRETLKRVRGADIDRIFATMQAIQEAKRTRRSRLPRIVVNFVAQADNIRELPELAQRAAGLGVHFFAVTPLHHFPGIEEGEDRYSLHYRQVRLATIDRAEAEAAIRTASEIAARCGMHFHSYVDPDYEWRASRAKTGPPRSEPDAATTAQAPKPLPPFYCLHPWMSLYLSADRTAKVCCQMGDVSFGTFASPADVERVWFGPRLTALRKAIAAGDVHPACRSCVENGRYVGSFAYLSQIERSLGFDDPQVDASREEAIAWLKEEKEHLEGEKDHLQRVTAAQAAAIEGFQRGIEHLQAVVAGQAAALERLEAEARAREQDRWFRLAMKVRQAAHALRRRARAAWRFRRRIRGRPQSSGDGLRRRVVSRPRV